MFVEQLEFSLKRTVPEPDDLHLSTREKKLSPLEYQRPQSDRIFR